MRGKDELEGFKFGGKVVKNLRYVDDIVIVSESNEQLQQLINVVVTESERKTLYLNSAKSFTMVLINAKVNPTCNITVHGKIWNRSSPLSTWEVYSPLKRKG